jgi:hypothetical protein
MRSAAPSAFWRKRLLLGLTTLAPLGCQGRRATGRIEIGSAVTISVHTTTLGVIEPSFPQRL